MKNQYQKELGAGLQRNESEGRLNALREQGGVFVEAVRVTRMPMAVTDATLPGNPIIFANRSFERLSGYALAELMGQQPHFLADPDASRDTLSRFAAAIQEGRDEIIDMPLFRKDGSRFHSTVFVSPLRDEDGKVIHHFLSSLDITRRVAAEDQLRDFAAQLEAKVLERTRALEATNERLRALLAERDTLVAEVNHRAKNSLNIASSILGLKAMRESDEAARAVLLKAQQRLIAMARVHDILSRTEAGQRVALGTYFGELWAALQQAMANGERIRMSIEVPEELALPADTAVPVGLIVTELLMNALKYAFPDGRQGDISVRASRKRDAVELVVCDDGIGISADTQESVGTGIVRALAQQIGASISITGQPGVCVTLVFPPEGAEG